MITREEFIDKVGVANRAIENFNRLVNNMIETKQKETYEYIKLNKKFDVGDRVRVYKSLSDDDLEKKELLGTGYVVDIFVDDADGLILYKVKKEINKEKTEEDFFKEFAVDFEFFNEYSMLIEKV